MTVLARMSPSYLWTSQYGSSGCRPVTSERTISTPALGGLVVETLAKLDAGDRLDDAGHVLYVGGVEYLAAGHHALDEEAAQTGAARMNGGGQAGDSTTNDDRVVRRVGHCVHRVLPSPSARLGSGDILQLSSSLSRVVRHSRFRRPLHNLSFGRKPEAMHLAEPGLSPSPQPSPANGRGGLRKGLPRIGVRGRL